MHEKAKGAAAHLATNVDSMKSLGWALKRYPGFVEKFDCKPVRYVLKVHDEVKEQ